MTNDVSMTRKLDQAALVKDLRAQVSILEKDLRARSDEVEEFASALRSEYDLARAAKRTAATYGAWRDERVTQVGAAWVLAIVFVRFCEDNGLIEWPFIAGPGERLVEAEERHEAFFREHPQLNDRDWIIEAFTHLASSHPAVAGLFDKRYNPLWEITPSFEAVTALLTFWRRRDDEGNIRHSFADVDTRFLGDLYQDLSKSARKTYALLQTPEFVEEFILDLTLEPAIDEFGLAGLRTIDPACGSGHFLLGIFHRLLKKWRVAEPGTNDWELIRRSLESVHGCDKNPFAGSVARFRLLIAALRAGGEGLLGKAPVFPINIAIGDSLLHGRGAPAIQEELFSLEEPYTYRTEDVSDFVKRCDLLGRSSYHVVVGNPPYITVKDKRENENYRRGYSACSGTYALSVPFAQCLFQLAIRTNGSDRMAGYVGQITAQSFMKHEFGKRLINDFFPRIHLTHIIDTSGARIPGHGTPTAILVGRNTFGRSGEPIRSAVGLQGEPSEPADASKGMVWSAIVDQITQPGTESKWIYVADSPRDEYLRYPWTLAGGGGTDLVRRLVSNGAALDSLVASVGYTGQTNADDVFLSSRRVLDSRRIPRDLYREFVTGDDVRDFRCEAVSVAVFPYDSSARLRAVESVSPFWRWMWPYRTRLGARATFGRSTYLAEGRPWWSWHQVAKSRLSGPVVTWPVVQTHQHFVYLAQCQLHNRHAPVIKLPQGASEEDHLGLLGVLNSSTACFWLKQVSHGKGNGGVNEGYRGDDWEEFYEFTGTKLQEFPVPKTPPLDLGRRLDGLAQRLSSQEPSAVPDHDAPTRDVLDAARAQQERVRGQMVALQEEIDWTVYRSYGLLSEVEAAELAVTDLDTVPEVRLGERAFEIVLARRIAAGEAESAWFARHGSTPITEIPSHWPEWYREIVQARIDIIEKRRDIALIERPECKRRWATQPWEKREAEALRAWLLDRCENPDLWFALRDGFRQPRALTVNQLADLFRDDDDMQSVAQLYADDHLGKRDLSLAQVLESIVADQHVPYLAALRYKESGLRKRAEWEHVWDLQREEDRTGERLDIPVPPKYGSGDFRKTSYWSQRGKLDVPKERFVSYPDANPDSDPSLLLGWAGWDHRDQAQALINLVNDRTDQAGWGVDKITPLLAGLLELMPWVKQWHGSYDEEWGGTPAEEYQAFLEMQRARLQLTEGNLRGWEPKPTRRGRRTATKG